MKSVSLRFLQAKLVLLGIAALAFLLSEPHVEGRNAQATLLEVYLQDPFLVYAYIGSIPFFVALYQTVQLLESVRRDEFFSARSLAALRTIQTCALAVVGFVVLGVVWIVFFSETDDHAPAVVLGGVLSLVLLTAATAAARGAERLQGVLNGMAGRSAPDAK